MSNVSCKDVKSKKQKGVKSKERGGGQEAGGSFLSPGGRGTIYILKNRYTAKLASYIWCVVVRALSMYENMRKSEAIKK
jgi:hypothetical protein